MRRNAGSALTRAEVILLAFCLAGGAVASGAFVGWTTIAGSMTIGMYAHYSIAAALGWVCGNLFVLRRYRHGASTSLMVPVYLLGPQALLLLLWQMTPREWQHEAAIVPVLAAAVFVVFFLVPWSLRFSGPLPRKLRLRLRGKDEESRR